MPLRVKSTTTDNRSLGTGFDLHYSREEGRGEREEEREEDRGKRTEGRG
jgi:hypothetical protein